MASLPRGAYVPDQVFPWCWALSRRPGDWQEILWSRAVPVAGVPGDIGCRPKLGAVSAGNSGGPGVPSQGPRKSRAEFRWSHSRALRPVPGSRVGVLPERGVPERVLYRG